MERPVSTTLHVCDLQPAALSIPSACRRVPEGMVDCTVGAGVAWCLPPEREHKMCPELAAATPLWPPLLHWLPLPLQLTSGRSVLTPLLDRTSVWHHMACLLRQGSPCSCWLLSVVAPSCCCHKHQPVLLLAACSTEVSHSQHAGLPGRLASQASTSAKCSRVRAWLPGSVQQMCSGCW